MSRRPSWSMGLVLLAAASCSRRPPPPPVPPLPADEILHEKALALQREDRFGEAERTWGDLLSRYPETPRAAEALFWLGFDQARAGKPREALASLGRLAARFPTGPLTGAALLKASQIHRAGGSETDLAHAREDLEQVLARFPESTLAPEARVGLAQICEEALRLEPAIGFYDALAQEAHLPEAGRIAARNEAGRLRGLHAAGPSDAALLTRSNRRLRWGRPQEAREDLEKILARHPSGPLFEEAAYATGLCLALSDRPGDAAERFTPLAETASDAEIREAARHALDRLRRITTKAQ